MRMESVASSAVPVRAMPHVVRPGAVAFPWALQLIVPAVVNAPWAVPVILRSPAQVALNEPFADVEVCSDTVHLKSVHEFADGMMLPELHAPISALLPTASGPSSVLLRSKPMHAEVAAAAAIENATSRMRFFICESQSGLSGTRVPADSRGGQDHTIRKTPICCDFRLS